MFQQLPRPSSVFRRHQIAFAQNPQRSKRYILKISDGCCDQIEGPLTIAFRRRWHAPSLPNPFKQQKSSPRLIDYTDKTEKTEDDHSLDCQEQQECKERNHPVYNLPHNLHITWMSIADTKLTGSSSGFHLKRTSRCISFDGQT